MRIDQADAFCLSLPHATRDQPFGPDVVAYRIGNRIFALLSLDHQPPRINLKCDPERAVALREEYACVLPGYHQDKRHWNTVILDGTAPPAEVRRWIEDSFDLVAAGLTRALRRELQLDERLSKRDDRS
jgi:predicted DNA-binding protein (MmcQ/YjbR family)